MAFRSGCTGRAPRSRSMWYHKLMASTVKPTDPGRPRPCAARLSRGCAVVVMALLAVASCGGEKPKSGSSGDNYKAAPDTLIKELRIGTGKPYRWVPFHSGLPIYFDRDYYYGTFPEKFLGFPVLLTSNEDKFILASTPLVSFTAVRPIRVFLLHVAVMRSGSAGALWFNQQQGWNEERWKIGTNKEPSTIVVSSRPYAAGERVDLPGAGCINNDCDNYGVLVTPEPPP